MSQPWGLDESKDFIISSISTLVTRNKVILAFALYKKGDEILVFYISVHMFEKKSLKGFAFSQKFETNLPSINSGGIAGILLLQSRRLRIAKYALGAVEGKRKKRQLSNINIRIENFDALHQQF